MGYSPEKRPRTKTRRTFLAGCMPLQFERQVACPYCGESFIFMIDGSVDNQSYYEECEICCRPILFHTEVDSDGNLLVFTAHREDD
jgi:hypothetical protein